MEWLLLLAIPLILVVALCFLPIRIRVVYDDGGLLADIYVGPLKFRLFPGKDTQGSESKLEFKFADKDHRRSNKTSPAKKSAGGVYKDFIAYAKFFLNILDDLRKKIVIKNLQLKMLLAGGDPYDLALNYGRGWTAAGNLLALLERAFTIKKHDISVDCDFLGEQTCVVAELIISITLGRFVGLCAKYAKRYYAEFDKILIIRKGGAN